MAEGAPYGEAVWGSVARWERGSPDPHAGDGGRGEARERKFRCEPKGRFSFRRGVGRGEVITGPSAALRDGVLGYRLKSQADLVIRVPMGGGTHVGTPGVRIVAACPDGRGGPVRRSRMGGGGAVTREAEMIRRDPGAADHREASALASSLTRARSAKYRTLVAAGVAGSWMAAFIW